MFKIKKENKYIKKGIKAQKYTKENYKQKLTFNKFSHKFHFPHDEVI